MVDDQGVLFPNYTWFKHKALNYIFKKGQVTLVKTSPNPAAFKTLGDVGVV